MKTIETTAVVGEDRRLTVQLPADVEPGAHQVVVVIGEGSVAAPAKPPDGTEWKWPLIDVGPWPEGLSLRREDMYGDDGR